jgi:hypothetical protein
MAASLNTLVTWEIVPAADGGQVKKDAETGDPVPFFA